MTSGFLAKIIMQTLKKISLWIIYAGAALALAAPLFVNNSFFFPFIATKAFLFRIVVEIMLLAFLYLALVDEQYRPKRNILTIILGLFIIGAFISSFLGVNFYGSFWGDMERSDGLFLLLHLAAFFVILTSVIKTEKTWARFFDISLVVALLVSLFAVAQSLKLESVLATSGDRADATFGNASFLAGYILFQIAFAAYLFWKRNSKIARIYYGTLAALFIWVIFATQTRGALVALVGSIVFSSLLLVWTKRHIPIIRKSALGAIILVVAAVGLLIVFRDRPFVKNSPMLNKLTVFSFTDRTTETRIAAWRAGIEGWKDKPIFGYGLENYNIVFNKNFPPIIYKDEGSVVWFDRAHNVVVDRAVTTGIVGLLLYLGFIFYPAYYMLKRLRGNEEKQVPAIIFISLAAAYFVQDLFVFESIGTYVFLFFAWAFMASNFLPKFDVPKILTSKKLWLGALAVYLLLLGPIMWKGTLEPAKINLAAAVALRSNPVEDNFYVIFDRFKDVLEKENYGQNEYRIQFIDFIGTQLGEQGPINPEVFTIVTYAEEQLEKLISEKPDDAKNYLLAARFYNTTRDAVPGEEKIRIERALSYIPKLQELTPTRPHGPQEAGYSYLYLYEDYKEAGDAKQAEDSAKLAEEFFLKTIELNSEVVESYINLVRLYFMQGRNGEIADLIDEMEIAGANYKQAKHLTRMLGLAKTARDFDWISFFTEELTKVEPDNVDAWIDFALSYAYRGERAEAIAIADVIKGFGGNYIAEAEAFIENVNSGFYEKNPLK